MAEPISPIISDPSSGCFISPKAADIYKLFNLSFSVPPNLRESSLSSLDFLESLIAEKCHRDAVEFLAHGLPNYLGLEWAHACMSYGKKDDSKEEPLLKKIQDWLNQPDDTIRRAIGAQGEQTGFDNPLGWLAMAVFWSEGSMTPEEGPETLPPPNIRPNMTAGAIILLAAQGNPANIEQSYRVFLDIGMTTALKGTLKKGS